MISTDEFTVAPSATAARLARLWLWRRRFFLALPVAALAIAGMADWRFLVVALMVVFIIWPMALGFVWINAALAPDAVRASQPHRMEFTDDGIRTVYTPRDGYPPVAPQSVAWSDVKNITDDGRTVAIEMHDGRDISVPASLLTAAQWQQVRAIHISA
ncbi:MAG: YcxB family protein [Muribaculaceae bacterium]|nr:YcxB family protein [Muribaculaceae bacterium]